MSQNLFVTGTGTDVGKTYVTGLIVKKLAQSGKKAAYYKAAMSGNERQPNGELIPNDALHVKTIAQISQPLEEMCPYVYETAVSPHLASKMEGNPVELEQVLEKLDDLCGQYDYVTVEGSGGIVCPLRYDTQEIFLKDLITARKMGCLIVAHAGLGTINAVVLTVEYMKSNQIPIQGIILNQYEQGNPLHEDNQFMCEWMTGIPVLACVKNGDTELELPVEQLQSLYE